MTRHERAAELAGRAPSIVRFTLVAFIVPIVLAAILFWLRHEVIESDVLRRQAAASFERQIVQTEVLSLVKDAETAQRGYLVTGDPAFLEPIGPASRAIRNRLTSGRTSDESLASDVYHRRVVGLVDAKFAELDRTIMAARAGRVAEARRMVAAGRGSRLMDELREVIGRQVEAEAIVTRDRRAAFMAKREELQAVVLVVVLALSFALLVFLAVLWRSRNQRHDALIEAFESAERNSTILNGTVDAILILNPSGTVEVVNAAATRMLGYSGEDLDRRDIATIIDIAPGEGSFHKRVGLVDGNLTRSYLSDRTVLHSDGRLIPVDVAMGVMRVPSGDHLVVSLRDISERKRIERMKDDLMSTVSHELRTPLTSIVGSLGLLKSGAAGPLPLDAARPVNIAENNSRRLIRLINDMLDIDRIESGKLHVARETIDLRSVVDQACVGSEGLARAHGVAIDCDVPDQPVMVSGDGERLLQVVSNLMSNAIRLSPKGAQVDITLAQVDARDVVVCVEDRGPGVPIAFRERIFGRFERADHDAATGTGLGLAISREIVARHDGRIWFEDRVGGGTRFCFSLAVMGMATASDADAPRVLVCEADETSASELCAIALGEGCSYDVVADVAQAQAAIANQTYAAVIANLTLPDIGKIGFAWETREGVPPDDASVLAVVTVAQNDSTGAAALEVVGWVDRPGDTERLKQVLRTALSRPRVRRPVVLHLDDDRDLLEVVAAALEPEVKIVTATNLSAARALLRECSPDAVILDLRLADGAGTDLIPFLVDDQGRKTPTVIYSAQDVSADLAARVDAVLVKARGSLPDLKATLRRLVRAQIDQRQQP